MTVQLPVIREVENFRRQVLLWGADNFAEFPWRFTDNRWHALVAEIMLQRTKAEQVVPAFFDFSEKYDSPRDYFEDGARDIFETLGLRWRIKYFRDLVEILVKQEKVIPEIKEELVELPGIGSYIASAFRSMHLNLCDVIIDSNIVRIYGRYFGFETDGETRRKRWFIELAEKMTPVDSHRMFNYAMLDITREVCAPKPRCEICPLSPGCSYYKTLSTP